MIRSFLLIVFIIVLGTDEAFALSPVVVQASASFVTTVWRRRVQQLQPVTSSRQQRRRVGVPTVTAQLAQPSRSSLQMSRASFLVLSASSSDDDELEFLGNTDGIGKARSTATTATTITTTTTASQQQQQAPNNDNNTKQQQQQQQQHRRWIILVDDELAIRQAVGALLEQAGYEVTTCADAMSAWQLLVTATATTTTTTTNASTKSSSRHVSRIPAAVVSDVRMPGAMDGLDLVRRMRGIYNNNNNDSNEHLVAMPVVLLTAKARQTSDRITGYQAGADVYLPKPFDPAELVVILDNLLQQYDQVNAVDHSSSGSSSSSHSSNNANNRLVRQAANDGLSDNNDNSGRVPGVSANSSNSGISLEDIQKDVAEIKQLLLQGGAGIGSGYVARHQSASDDNSNKDARGAVVFLAPDERQVLELLCQGLPNAEIAQRTYLSKRRVEQLLTNMFRKTNVKNRTELVRWAVATGNVQL